MEAKSAKNIISFPFEALPHVSAQKWQLKKRLFHIYTLFSEKENLLQDIIQPLEKILKQEISAELIQIETQTISDIVSTLPQRVLLTLLRVDPYPKRAFLSFDLGLAQVATGSVLSGGRAALSSLSFEQLKPITPLNEAVIEYLVVSFLQKVTDYLGPARFALGFEEICQEPKKLLSFYANTDEIALFTIGLTIQDKKFFVKVGLPIQAAQDFSSQDNENDFFHYRLQSFLGLKNDFVLELGHVELDPEELHRLEEGDIILLDESGVTLNEKKSVQGEAVVRPAHGEKGLGYGVELSSHKGHVRAKIKELL